MFQCQLYSSNMRSRCTWRDGKLRFSLETNELSWPVCGSTNFAGKNQSCSVEKCNIGKADEGGGSIWAETGVNNLNEVLWQESEGPYYRRAPKCTRL